MIKKIQSVKRVEFVGRCVSCKKNKVLHDVNGLSMCVACEDDLFDHVVKAEEKKEFGRDALRNMQAKKKD